MWISRFLATLGLFAVILASCSPIAASPTLSLPPAPLLPSPTAPAPTETSTPTPTPTAVRTPTALPGVYQSPYLNPLDTPHTYLTDTCQYLKAKWDPNNAAPGTAVMVIMFHSILKAGDELTDYSQITSGAFEILMRDLHEQNFQAINIGQLADFLENNAKIPPRSVLLVVDDRHYAEYFNTDFRPYWEQWGWPVVNAWISTPLSSADLWQQQVNLENEGWVDHQAHGMIHNIGITSSSTDDFIMGEMKGSIDAFQTHFNKKPIAYIWPLGWFTAHAAQIGRQLGYRLGFTINPRGPLMFNWIPLSDNPDPQRPSYMPEDSVNDPLMVLPRFWSSDADKHIDDVRVIGREAANYAEANKATELEYYDIVCAPDYGPIPIATP